MGAKLGPFAGYLMPVQYAQGVIAEHLHTRSKASLFDVSHMGQIVLPPHMDTALETLSPCDIKGLQDNHQRYGLFTNDQGGVIDDFMLVRRSSDLFLVVNASRKEQDLNLLQAAVDDVEEISDRVLLALQGPLAAQALARLVPAVAKMRFLTAIEADWENSNLWITRSGYTGEDGFEISAPISRGEALFNALLAIDEVEPAGLGARDTLRMEAGLPLYGQDLSENITPVEAGLTWAIGKTRRVGGVREGGFPGAQHIFEQIKTKPARRRVGLRPETKAPMRGGVPIFDREHAGKQIGAVTSGGYSPSLGCPIAIGLIDACVHEDTQLFGEVRGSRLPAAQTKLPFLPTQYRR
jgi:aminomethyltransferase